METEDELLVQHFVEGVDHKTDLPVVRFATQRLEMLPSDELDVKAPVRGHLVVPAVEFRLHGETEVVALGAITFDGQLTGILVEQEVGCEVDQFAANKDIAGTDPELDVLKEQPGVELELGGLVVEIEGGDDVGIPDGARVADSVLLPRRGVGERYAPRSILGVGASDTADGGRNLLLFAGLRRGIGGECRRVRFRTGVLAVLLLVEVAKGTAQTVADGWLGDEDRNGDEGRALLFLAGLVVTASV